MSVTRGQHPGLRRIRDARGLRQPPARQAWAEDRLLEPGERGDRRLSPIIRLGLLADGQFAHLRGPWAYGEAIRAGRAIEHPRRYLQPAIGAEPLSVQRKTTPSAVSTRLRLAHRGQCGPGSWPERPPIPRAPPIGPRSEL